MSEVMAGKCPLFQEGNLLVSQSAELAVSFRHLVRVQDFMKVVDDFKLKLQRKRLFKGHSKAQSVTVIS